MTSNIAHNQLKRKLKPFEIRDLWISRIIIWIVLFLVTYPMISIISASLSPGETFMQKSIIPENITFDNYIAIFTQTDFPIWLRNSFILCTCVAIIQVAITLPASYAFSRLRFTGRRYGLMFLLILQIFPSIMMLPAILGLAYALDFMDKFPALILLYSGGSAYYIWLLKGFIDGIPKELDEAAYIDGASSFQILLKVILPLSRAMLVVMFILNFFATYSDFILPSALMKDKENYVVAVGLFQFIRDSFSTNWSQFAAAAVVASVPISIIFSLAQKYIAKGLVSGAVKE